MSIRDIPNSVALPQSVQMKLKPNAVPATRKRINIQPYTQPTGGVVSNSTQLAQFYIPARRNTMYDPQTMYLRGRISGTNGNAATTFLNRNAFSLINRLQVYGQDSTLLEDIQNYNDLAHVLMDIQMGKDDKVALSSMYGGSAAEYTATATTALTNTNVGQVGIGAFPLAAVNAGADYGAAAGMSATTTVSIANNFDNGVQRPQTVQNRGLCFCIPIISAFGLLSDTMIPVGWLNADLRFDFYLESATQVLRDSAGGVTSYTLSDLELVVDTVEFDPSSMALVNQFAPVNGPLFCHATTYKTYTASHAAASVGYNTTLVPHRSLSVKQLLACSHNTALDNAATNGADPFSRLMIYGSPDMGLGLNIGGLKYPQKPISNYSEAFAELQKSQHAFNQLILNGSISRTEYCTWDTAVGGVSQGLQNAADSLVAKPVIGFDTEIYDKKGSTIINGQNWTGLNVFIEGTIAANNNVTTGLTVNTRSNYFVNYDLIYIVQDGQISVRF